ncbi:TIGR04149 family rSAM-modified RiPP [Alistipes putredinis]|jgi:natural product precursor|uniref:TIGR04149 family rSAM-modified RiPP n=1 Tax=Alistipes putredinis TaxID=28117 RepID=UPI003AB71818
MKSLKVNQIEKNNLSEKEMQHIAGGQHEGMCGCGCMYEGQGGSSTMDNGLANADTGLWRGDKFTCIQSVIVVAKRKDNLTTE